MAEAVLMVLNVLVVIAYITFVVRLLHTVEMVIVTVERAAQVVLLIVEHVKNLMAFLVQQIQTAYLIIVTMEDVVHLVKHVVIIILIALQDMSVEVIIIACNLLQQRKQMVLDVLIVPIASLATATMAYAVLMERRVVIPALIVQV
jgi:hypothetical protein